MGAKKTTPSESRAPRVLFVEDEPPLRKMVLRLLEQHAYDVVAAADVEAALEDLRTFRPDVVVVDLSLGGRDGREVVAAARALGKAGPRVIVSSGAAHRSVDADAFLDKPFLPDELLEVVGAAAGIAMRSGSRRRPKRDPSEE